MRRSTAAPHDRTSLRVSVAEYSAMSSAGGGTGVDFSIQPLPGRCMLRIEGGENV